MRRLRFSARGFTAAAVRRPREAGACARGGFTLVELLVVIAIIAILASLLLPVLSRSKAQALTTACLNNIKQLEVCWHLYAGDNLDYMPPNNFVYDIVSGQPLDQGSSWCTNLAPYEADPVGITGGLLYTYNSSVPIYRCPADSSVVETKAGVKLGTPRLRSYNMSQSVDGPNYDGTLANWVPTYQKLTQIADPTPSALFVFIEVHQDEIVDTQFGIPTPTSWWCYPNYWWDIPANRHSQGANLSFADGHAEHWKWKVPKVATAGRGAMQRVLPEEKDDYLRMQTGFRQTFN